MELIPKKHPKALPYPSISKARGQPQSQHTIPLQHTVTACVLQGDAGDHVRCRRSAGFRQQGAALDDLMAPTGRRWTYQKKNGLRLETANSKSRIHVIHMLEVSLHSF